MPIPTPEIAAQYLTRHCAPVHIFLRSPFLVASKDPEYVQSLFVKNFLGPKPEDYHDMNKNCASCHFWDNGVCRRYPPQMVLWPVDNQHPVLYSPMASFPDVGETQWCGEWKKKSNE